MSLKVDKCRTAPHKTLFSSEYFVEPNITDDSFGFIRFNTGHGALSEKDDYVQFCMAGKYKW